MAKFNTARVRKHTPTKTNFAGGRAHAQSAKLELVSILLTAMLNGDRYYESNDDTIKRMIGLLDRVDPLFAAKAAVYARNEFGLRSISHIAAAEIAKRVKGESWTKRFVNAVVRRPDDMTEIMAYHLATSGKPVPNSMKKGLATAFDKFDHYQLAKYRGEGKTVSLVDLVNMVHPVPTRKNAKALADLVAGTLKSTGTWEAKLTTVGQTSTSDQDKAAKKAAAWTELVRERKIGYFALLRNLRNIVQTAPELVDDVCALLTDESLIHKSLVLPFRFTTAYDVIDRRKIKLVRALNKALDISCANVPDLPRSLVVCDFSGSMGGGIKSNRGIGTLLGAILAKRSEADFMIFGSYAAYVPFNPDDSVMTLFDSTVTLNSGWSGRRNSTNVGHGTNFEAIFETADKAYDRIFVFSDMQGWMGRGAPDRAVAAYKKRFNCDPYIYSMDLAGHGTMMFPEDKVACIPGFSDKIFGLIAQMETDKEALIKKIDAIDF